MVNWQDPDVIVYCFFLYEQIAVFMLGFYGTQFLNTLSIDLELLTRRRAFRPVHAPYLLARYITLAALLFFVVTGRVRNRISCDPAYRIFASLGCFAASLASLLLGSRPATIFWTLKIRAPLFLLLVLGLGQLCLAILQGSTAIRATWSDEQAMCVVYQWDPRALAAFYVYTFGYDVVILLMTLYAVHGVQQQQHRKRWGLGDILCIQGIGYVVATCVANLPIAVLAFLDLNPGMGVLLSLPAMTTRHV
ncbi:hypothetical protein C8Q80DRAFT_1271180 [Daedaleopsis nitida]|nr:hypothetical protein C8Q80DRAFT_1271180 [Daedaleopsis nitida]